MKTIKGVGASGGMGSADGGWERCPKSSKGCRIVTFGQREVPALADSTSPAALYYLKVS